MSEQNQKLPRSNKKESRVMPLLFAGLFCFVIAALLGYGSWTVLGSQARENGETKKFLQRFGMEHLLEIETAKNEVGENITAEIAEIKATPEIEKQDDTTVALEEPITETSIEIKGIVNVEGKEFQIGGGQTKRPLQRVFVDDFLIAETEVTNAQYADFIEATGHRSPSGWNKTKFPKDTEDFPVVNVSLSDANAFCKWLGEKYKMTVRLPKQAEWELAASGPNRFKYPWGNDWNDAGVEKKKDTKANKVKKYPINKSPYGAYDMLGNVWEWTAEQITRKELESEDVKKATSKNAKIYLALGGSFIEDRKKLRNTFWAELKADLRTKSLGFRYVIIPSEINNKIQKDEEVTSDTK